ncbi:MAG: branched-chain amino acid transport system substrate-binding protein [Mycobacterium sp.]|nr:branched-chain amino acid transport system substrate-binding protein [Mycobacterium sp.]MDT5240324.1 branched-chain amino acid transport system substrate-binding protein [Mycobacterium sp.]MDT5291940.1 branched-chain amino acid transport system substrate-binding protein [Mycobacterium sp.]MDT5299265.1 branched-chain amino acid transport system substrate-binding protein [Mycobacterium sp.]
MRRTTPLRALIGLAVVVLAASGCTADRPENSDTVTIGASLPLTGEFSQGGLDTQHGYETWVEMTNEKGGLLGKPVQIIVKDDATTQDTAVTNYNNLISQDKVNLLLGSQSSLLNIPASAVAEKNKMLFVCPSCGSPDMYNRGFKYIFFSQQAVATEQARVFAEWIAALPADQRPKTAAYPSLDDPFAGPVVEGAEKILSAAGIQTVYRDEYPATTKNFDAVVNAMKDAGAEMVVQGAQFEDGVNMIRSMNRAGYKPSIVYQSSSPTYGQQYIDGVGAQNADGVFFSSSYSPLADTKDNAEFVKKFEDKFGGLPPEDAADGFAAAQVLAAAVQAVGSYDDQAKLADWLRGNTVETVLGPLRWNEDGSPKGDFLVGQWQSGVSQVVLPNDVATSNKILRWQGGDI